MVEESDGTLIHSQGRGLGLWAEYFEEQFIWPTATAGLPLMPAGEPMQMDTIYSSEMEIVRVIEFHKKHNVAGLGGLLSFFSGMVVKC